jgi:hypothetical protein
MTEGVLLLSPSGGRGGGIERYVQTLEWALGAQGTWCQRADLRGPGPAAHARLLAQARRLLRASPVPVQVVAAHRALLPVAAALAGRGVLAGRGALAGRAPGRVSGVCVVCHGSELWGARARPRRLAENWLMGRPGMRVIAVSGYTAGALPGRCLATVLPPGLSRPWFDTLVRAASAARSAAPALALAPQPAPRPASARVPGPAQMAGPAPGSGPGWRRPVRLVTAFRLGQWRGKGLPELLAAIASLGRADVRLTVCGSGPPPPDLLRAIAAHPFCELRAGLSDTGLAGQLAAADLFVLATRTRRGRRPCGEGFGLVLLEAQVAGTPVLAPACGGASDAFTSQVTGAAPAGESTACLAETLGDLLNDPAELDAMGHRAARLAREAFDPDRYAARVTAVLRQPESPDRRVPAARFADK